MIVRKEIKKLEELGRMPDESEDDLSRERSGLYANLLDSIEPPINLEEAKILIRLFPESTFYEVEWALLHIFETVSQIEEDKYIQLISQCPSKEWREILLIRLENYNKEMKKNECEN